VPGPIGVADLGWMRDAFATTLPDAVTVTRPGTPTRGSGGGVIPGAPVTVASVACRYAPSNDGTRALFGPELATLYTWHLRVPVGTDIAPGDTATIATVPYKVIAVISARSIQTGISALISRVA
jgi:hypothetical protein